jgi:hypothetical protein
MRVGLAVAFGLAAVWPAAGATIYDNNTPNGLMATASRLGSATQSEIESADDFLLTSPTKITGASFTGLVPTQFTVGRVSIEIYRIFPADSDVNRTSGPPTFSTNQVPTRVNSPADVAFASRISTAGGGLTFTTTTLSPSFGAANSVVNGINPTPNQTTHGEGVVLGTEVRFDVTFTTPFDLAAEHYFFVPQVELDTGSFLWLSAPKPIVNGFAFAPDLQTWIRDEDLDPDWLRVGTDIVGGTTPPTFNAAFALFGDVEAVPEPGTLPLLAMALLALGLLARRARV